MLDVQYTSDLDVVDLEELELEPHLLGDREDREHKERAEEEEVHEDEEVDECAREELEAGPSLESTKLWCARKCVCV